MRDPAFGADRAGLSQALDALIAARGGTAAPAGGLAALLPLDTRRAPEEKHWRRLLHRAINARNRHPKLTAQQKKYNQMSRLTVVKTADS